MKNSTRKILLAASLVTLASPAVGQLSATSNSVTDKTSARKHLQKSPMSKRAPSRQTARHSEGEAASLEKQEAGTAPEARDDNRGRFVAASHGNRGSKAGS